MRCCYYAVTNPSSVNLTASSMKSCLLNVRMNTYRFCLMKFDATESADIVLPRPGACFNSIRLTGASGCTFTYAKS